jgi:hypothetical protein
MGFKLGRLIDSRSPLAYRESVPSYRGRRRPGRRLLAHLGELRNRGSRRTFDGGLKFPGWNVGDTDGSNLLVPRHTSLLRSLPLRRSSGAPIFSMSTSRVEFLQQLPAPPHGSRLYPECEFVQRVIVGLLGIAGERFRFLRPIPALVYAGATGQGQPPMPARCNVNIIRRSARGLCRDIASVALAI